MTEKASSVAREPEKDWALKAAADCPWEPQDYTTCIAALLLEAMAVEAENLARRRCKFCAIGGQAQLDDNHHYRHYTPGGTAFNFCGAELENGRAAELRRAAQEVRDGK